PDQRGHRRVEHRQRGVTFPTVQPATSAVITPVAATVARHPCPYRARAWWGEQLVAESTAAIRVEEAGQAPALYFPCSDVRLELFRDERRTTTCPVKGVARLWSLPGDGRDVLWSFSDPAPDVA